MVLVLTRSTKQAARYIPGGGTERCSQCRFFYPQGTCGRIIGPVSPRGWCKYYSLEVVQRSQPGSTLSGGGPSLDMDFSTGTLDPRITFTRASTATYFDVTGALQTAATNAPRFDYNPVTHAARGLLIEVARTNLLLNSATLGTQSVAVTAQAYTLSFYGTGTITLTGASTAGPLVGTGAFPARTTPLTFTPTAGTLTLTVTGSVLNAQLEAGNFVTSWIPTTATTATRAAETATMPTGAWFNTAQGTLAVDSMFPLLPPSGTFPMLAAFSDGTANNRILTFYASASVRYRGSIYVGGSVVFDTITGAQVVATAGATAKTAISWNATTGQYAANGTFVATGAAVVPTVTLLGLGNDGASVTADVRYITRARYWPVALSAAQLQAITQ
jgi:hypothetical protein